MTVTIALEPQEEARLTAAAEVRGVPASVVVHEAVERMLLEAEIDVSEKDSRPIWEVILDIMKDVPDHVFDCLPKDGASQLDHYLYGHPKRDQ